MISSNYTNKKQTNRNQSCKMWNTGSSLDIQVKGIVWNRAGWLQNTLRQKCEQQHNPKQTNKNTMVFFVCLFVCFGCAHKKTKQIRNAHKTRSSQKQARQKTHHCTAEHVCLWAMQENYTVLMLAAHDEHWHSWGKQTPSSRSSDRRQPQADINPMIFCSLGASWTSELKPTQATKKFA